jgi:CRP-like cAMP-binding protein
MASMNQTKNKSAYRSQSVGRGHLSSDDPVSLFSNTEKSWFDQGRVEVYPAQTVIFHQDTQAHAVYLLEHGIVKLVRVVENGQSIIIGLRRRHWLIGAPCVLLDQMYSFTAITLVSSSMRCIPARDFLDLVKMNEGFSWYLNRLLSWDIIKQMKNVEAKNCMPAKDRMKRFLRDMIDEQNLAGSEPSNLSLPLTNKELSQILAISPEHLCRVLKELKQQGLIRHAKGVLTVNDPGSL